MDLLFGERVSRDRINDDLSQLFAGPNLIPLSDVYNSISDLLCPAFLTLVFKEVSQIFPGQIVDEIFRSLP